MKQLSLFNDYRYFRAYHSDGEYIIVKELMPMITLQMAKSTLRNFSKFEQDVKDSKYIGWTATVASRNFPVLNLMLRLGAVPYSVGFNVIHMARNVKEVSQ